MPDKLMFSDDQLKNLKKGIADKTLDETIMITGNLLHCILARLEAAEALIPPEKCNGGNEEKYQVWRRTCGRDG